MKGEAGSTQVKRGDSIRYWVGKTLIAIVVFLNLQAAYYFMVQPQNFAGGFELSGAAGNAMIEGVGLLFLMWNVPYLFALSNPIKRRTSLIEAVIMQAIGVIGETTLLLLLPSGHAQIEASVSRFILFDGSGLIVLLIAFFLTRKLPNLN